jgi:2-keto-3-deoxy-6-phosphogluconate aldolase
MVTNTHNKVLDSFSKAPVQLNIFPRYSVETVCRLIKIMNEEHYPLIEILARPIDDAIALLRNLNDTPHRKMIYIGIGTIKTEKDARRVVQLKPDFIVSPAFSRKVLNVAFEHGIPYIPAVRTFQDIQDVLDAFEEKNIEVKVLKFCPVVGLPKEYFSAVAGCFPGILFCPTGTVTLESLAEWKKIPCIAAPMESSFISEEWLTTGNFDAVRNRFKEIRELSKM